MSDETADRTDTQTTTEATRYPCACDNSWCHCSGFTSDDSTTVCQDCGRGNHEYKDEDGAL